LVSYCARAGPCALPGAGRREAAAVSRGRKPPTVNRQARARPQPLVWQLVARLETPQPLERLAFLRVLLPLATLGFLSSRLVHAADWLTGVGFQVPNLGRGDYRQPLYLPPLPVWRAWTLAAATLASGLAFAAGLKARLAGALFSFCLIYLALADRLAAFTVSKLGAMLMLALTLTPCAARYSLDARARR